MTIRVEMELSINSQMMAVDGMKFGAYRLGTTKVSPGRRLTVRSASGVIWYDDREADWTPWQKMTPDQHPRAYLAGWF